jgi:hypothetical protein
VTSGNEEISDRATLLKVLLKQRHLQVHSAFRREYDKVAAKIDRDLVGRAPAKAQFYRWLSGELTGLPYAHHCQVLEGMFPDWPVEQLFKPHSGSLDFVPKPMANANAAAGSTPPTVAATPQHSVIPERSGVADDRMSEFRSSLAGEWWACWQSWKDGQETINPQQVVLEIDTQAIRVHSASRGTSVEDGGYNWQGELQLWDNEALMGWYAANDGAVRSKGTMYFAIHRHGHSLSGRWTGLSYDGPIITGWAAMARTEDEALRILNQLRDAGEVSA